MKALSLILIFILSIAISGCTSTHQNRNEDKAVKVEQKPRAADAVAGVDLDLISAIRSGDASKADEAFNAGANPELVVCSVPDGNGGVTFGYVGSPNCTGSYKATLLELVFNRPYLKQPALITVLGKHHAKWGMSADDIIMNLVSKTKLDSTHKSAADYVPEKIAIAKALVDAGFVFPNDIIISNMRQYETMKQQENVAVTKAIAGFVNPTKVTEITSDQEITRAEAIKACATSAALADMALAESSEKRIPISQTKASGDLVKLFGKQINDRLTKWRKEGKSDKQIGDTVANGCMLKFGYPVQNARSR